jgi:hypothetical protein
MSVQIDQVLDWRGRAVVDRDGQKIGTFDEIYLDEGTNEPAWAAVKMRTFGLRRRVVPIGAAQSDGDGIRVPFTKAQVKSAPPIDSEGWVRQRDQAAIFRHYGMSGETNSATDRRPGATPEESLSSENSEPPGADGSDPRAADRHPGRVKLKRYTVTETVTRRSEFGPE